MQILDTYPVIIVPAAKLPAVRDFWAGHFGATAAFDSSWFVWMTLPGASGPISLAFMSDDHPTRPPGPETLAGRGAFLTLQVADAAEAWARLKDRAPVLHKLTDEAWGQRRFSLADPAGTMIDVVEQTVPEAGYWERYAAAG